MLSEFFSGIKTFSNAAESLLSLYTKKSGEKASRDIARFCILFEALHSECGTLIKMGETAVMDVARIKAEGVESPEQCAYLRAQELKNRLNRAVSTHHKVAQYFSPNNRESIVLDTLGLYIDELKVSGYVAINGSEVSFENMSFCGGSNEDELINLIKGEGFQQFKSAHEAMKPGMALIRDFVTKHYKPEIILDVSKALYLES